MPTKQKGRSKRRFYPLPLLIADEIGGVPVGRGGLKKQGKKGTPDNNNRTVNQPLRKDWNVVVNKKFIAKIHIYISPLITCRTHISQT